MPINYKDYPSNWFSEIRPAIMERAKNCCEFCGVKHYAVGSRVGEKFIPTTGNLTHDAAGNGELSYKEARELVKHCNTCCDDRLIVIVLTIAHLDHDHNNSTDDNLAALCQRCHLQHDSNQHAANRKYGRNWKKNQLIIDFGK